MKQCESCSENNPTDSNYCRKCGQSFSGEIKTFGLSFEESIDYIYLYYVKNKEMAILHILLTFFTGVWFILLTIWWLLKIPEIVRKSIKNIRSQLDNK